MELYREILSKEIEKSLQMNAAEIVEMRCYKALQEIKEIIQDDTLDDEDCFLRIEEIICVFEKIGSGGGLRHDF